jgi:hypothetical protein
MIKLVFALLGGLFLVLPGFADAPKHKEVFRSGEWVVMESMNPMTDKASCVALHNGNWKIQANPGKFFISLRGRGGVEGYVLRFGDAPAEEVRLANDSEKKLSSIIIEKEFDRLLASDRLRVQVLTILQNTVFEDIGLNGFKASVEHMKEKSC